MDGVSEHYASDVGAAMAALLGRLLVGVYLHGSAVLGGFDARRSDVDVLVVCEGPMSGAQRSAAVEALGERRLPCPARGLELSIVTFENARHPTAEPAFELHITTAGGSTRVVDGHGRGGDPDLVLVFAVCRKAGRLLGPGLPASEVLAPVPDALVLTQLARELRWAVEHHPDEYAVLNACRAWRHAVDGALTSKIDGGLWALSRVNGSDRALIRFALDRQRSEGAAGLDPIAVERFVAHILPRLI